MGSWGEPRHTCRDENQNTLIWRRAFDGQTFAVAKVYLHPHNEYKASKIFHGNKVRQVQQRYLRSDIWCLSLSIPASSTPTTDVSSKKLTLIVRYQQSEEVMTDRKSNSLSYGCDSNTEQNTNSHPTQNKTDSSTLEQLKKKQCPASLCRKSLTRAQICER